MIPIRTRLRSPGAAANTTNTSLARTGVMVATRCSRNGRGIAGTSPLCTTTQS